MRTPPGTELLHEFLLSPTAQAPDRPAVVELDGRGGARTTSYGELGDRVGRYVSALGELGLDVGDRVVLEAEASAASIAVLLACSSLGLTFVPVSPQTPQQRLEAIVSVTEPALYLQDEDGERTELPSGTGIARFGRGEVRVERCPAPGRRPRTEATVTDPAYIIFTSGSTGRPKGVVMSHRAVVALYRAMAAEGIVTATDRVASTSPLQFDFSLLNIGMALGCGAAVVPVPQHLVRWPRRFLGALEATQATQVNGVPSIWRQALLREPERVAGLTQLRGILFCGEEFPLPELHRMRDLLPSVRLVNCYGATESMAASFTDVPMPLPDDLERLSIGYAHQGAEMLLADENGGLVEEPGVVGEILLRSPALFSGYWDDAEATRAALIPDPVEPRFGQLVLRSGDLAHRGPDGELYFRGRRDSQVQVHGNRVELGEVQRGLLEHPDVAAAVALAHEPEPGQPVLAAFAVPGAHTAAPDAGELRAFLARSLPPYMVPQDLRVLDSLPVTANGKVDRAALAASLGGA